MSIFAFGEQRQTIGRFYRGEMLTGEQAMLRFDHGWSRDIPSQSTLLSATTSELAEEAGIDQAVFTKAVSGAIRAWRMSPSRSLINIIRNADLAVPGQPMFADLLEQTRVLGAGVEDEVLPIGRDSYMRTIRGEDKKQIKVAFDAYALTAIPVVACVRQWLAGPRRPGLWFQGQYAEPEALLRDMARMGVAITTEESGQPSRMRPRPAL